MISEKTKADLLLRNGRILTMDADRRILLDGAVAIADGAILAIGPDREVAPMVEARDVRHLNGALVHPGFVDAHIHTGADLIRGLLPEGSSDWSAVEAPFNSLRTAEDEYLAAMLSCMEMVTNGTTLWSDTGGSFDLASTVKAIETVGMRAIPGYFLSDVPGEGEIEGLDHTTDECLELLIEQLESYPFQGGGRVRCVATLCGMGIGSDRLLVEAKALADKGRVPIIFHQSWDEGEVEMSQTKYGNRPIEHLADLGILGPNLTLIHMIQLDSNEIDLVAQSASSVVHCPAASTRRAMGAIRVGRFPEMLEAGITVALGSDGLSSKHDMARQAYLAATLHREVKGEVPTITAQRALEMATLHGARALGMEEEVGSLEVGKRADLVIHGLDRPESRPRFRDPVTNLVYYSLSRTVETVMVEGEFIFERGEFTRFDKAETYNQLDARSEIIEERIGFQEPNSWPLIG